MNRRTSRLPAGGLRNDAAPGRKEPWRADVIIVLGAKTLPGARASTPLQRRLAHGAALFHRGHAPRLLLTGGIRGRPPSEAAVMRDLAIGTGVPAELILLEPTARNTLENAVFSARMMHERGWHRALIVTDRLHLPRALLLFRMAGIEARGNGVAGGWRKGRPVAFAAYLLHEAGAFVRDVASLAVRRNRS